MQVHVFKNAVSFGKAALLTVLAVGAGFAQAASTPEPPVPIETTQTAQLYFIQPTDGATVDRPFAIKYGVRTVTVTPGMSPPVTAAPDNQVHLLIDAPPASATMPVLRSDQVRLVSDTQPDKFVLPSGPHRLQLIQTDKNGVPAPLPVVSPVINVIVK